MTRKTFLVRYNGIIKKVKIQTAFGFQSVFILNGTSIFLTWKVLKYIIQGIYNFKLYRLLKFLRIRNGTHDQNTQRSVLVSASISILPVPTSPRRATHSRVLNSSPLFTEESSCQPWFLNISIFQAIIFSFQNRLVQLYFLNFFLFQHRISVLSSGV